MLSTRKGSADDVLFVHPARIGFRSRYGRCRSVYCQLPLSVSFYRAPSPPPLSLMTNSQPTMLVKSPLVCQ